ncbi:hypothetical protein [Lysobacter gummosus]|uniref:hypothetical protein n=1 Tax=Lysobacter gummosus TaxID=262324 RepID=UPI00363045B2
MVSLPGRRLSSLKADGRALLCTWRRGRSGCVPAGQPRLNGRPTGCMPDRPTRLPAVSCGIVPG